MEPSSLPLIVSVDDHVVEPPHLFERWMPRKFLDDAPRVVRRNILSESAETRQVVFDDDHGLPADCWFFGDMVYAPRRPVVIPRGMEVSPDIRTNDPVTYDEMRPGCYEPRARLEDMSSNHVEASLGFPSFPRFCGQEFYEQTSADRELGLACVQAYNDWMVDEWCGDSKGRLIPLCLIPLWDVGLAVTEVLRNASRGVRAVAFSEIIYHLGLPSIHTRYWDPFFAACEETGTVICMHIGSSSKLFSTSPDAPAQVAAALSFNNSFASLADFVYSGALVRFPRLKLAYSEGQIGWIPYALERMDQAWISHPWARGEILPETPSFYFRQSVYGCFFSDRHGIESLDKIGVDNVTFETDYPHADGTFPNSLEHALLQLSGLGDEAVYKIVRGNAIRIFELGLSAG